MRQALNGPVPHLRDQIWIQTGLNEQVLWAKTQVTGKTGPDGQNCGGAPPGMDVVSTRRTVP